MKTLAALQKFVRGRLHGSAVSSSADCRKCERCEIAEYLLEGKISFSCLAKQIATDHCPKFKKGAPKEVEWINGH